LFVIVVKLTIVYFAS